MNRIGGEFVFWYGDGRFQAMPAHDCFYDTLCMVHDWRSTDCSGRIAGIDVIPEGWP